jgi:succinate-semialdehyde dehydrogenase/glutarate-semialdehyde dehydrogenase
VKKTLAVGGRLLYGELDYKMQDEALKNGFFTHPLILENIHKDSPAYNEELFGPVFSLFRFNDELEAIELANSSQYGLSGSIYSRDLERARAKAMQLEGGSIFINDIVASDPAIPGGGVKDSGYGRECYTDGLHETLNRKSIVYGTAK